VTRQALLGLLIALLTACAVGPAALSGRGPLDHRVYVTSNDWHTRIVVATREIPGGLLVEADELPVAPWLAIGWGDHAYYPMPDPPLGLALKAAFLPSPAVIHLIPMAVPPRPFDGFEVLEIAISEVGHLALVDGIDAAFDRQGRERAPVAAPGLYPESLFFPAKGRFHLLNTCNSWVARQLIAAGLPIRARGVVTAEDLMRQLRGLPTVRPALG
jgi:uncharacterized protein (TIGR02117 family)